MMDKDCYFENENLKGNFRHVIKKLKSCHNKQYKVQGESTQCKYKSWVHTQNVGNYVTSTSQLRGVDILRKYIMYTECNKQDQPN